MKWKEQLALGMPWDYAYAQEKGEMPTLGHHAMAPASAAAQGNLGVSTSGVTVLN